MAKAVPQRQPRPVQIIFFFVADFRRFRDFGEPEKPFFEIILLDFSEIREYYIHEYDFVPDFTSRMEILFHSCNVSASSESADDGSSSE